MSATVKNLKDSRVLIITRVPFRSLIWPVQKTAGSWKMTVEYCKLNQALTPTAALFLFQFYYRSGFLKLGPVDILEQIILCGEGLFSTL